MEKRQVRTGSRKRRDPHAREGAGPEHGQARARRENRVAERVQNHKPESTAAERTDDPDKRLQRRHAEAGVCRILRAMRRRARLSQSAVAVRLRRPTSFFGKYENGYRRLDVIEFLEVAEAIGFNPSEFVRAVEEQRHA